MRSAILIRDFVNERLSSALKASSPVEDLPPGADDDLSDGPSDGDGIVTTQEEISGFHIVQAIASPLRELDPLIPALARSHAASVRRDQRASAISLAAAGVFHS